VAAGGSRPPGATATACSAAKPPAAASTVGTAYSAAKPPAAASSVGSRPLSGAKLDDSFERELEAELGQDPAEYSMGFEKEEDSPKPASRPTAAAQPVAAKAPAPAAPAPAAATRAPPPQPSAAPAAAYGSGRAGLMSAAMLDSPPTSPPQSSQPPAPQAAPAPAPPPSAMAHPGFTPAASLPRDARPTTTYVPSALAMAYASLPPTLEMASARDGAAGGAASAVLSGAASAANAASAAQQQQQLAAALARAERAEALMNAKGSLNEHELAAKLAHVRPPQLLCLPSAPFSSLQLLPTAPLFPSPFPLPLALFPSPLPLASRPP
jgi:hypothetical protein